MKKENIEEYIKFVEAYLTKRFGSLNNEWRLTIELLHNTLKRYAQVTQILEENGIYDEVNNRKNTLLGAEKDLLSTIMKLQQKLGISPYDNAKIKIVEDNDGQLLLDLMCEE